MSAADGRRADGTYMPTLRQTEIAGEALGLNEELRLLNDDLKRVSENDPKEAHRLRGVIQQAQERIGSLREAQHAERARVRRARFGYRAAFMFASNWVI